MFAVCIPKGSGVQPDACSISLQPGKLRHSDAASHLLRAAKVFCHCWWTEQKRAMSEMALGKCCLGVGGHWVCGGVC